MLYRTRYGEAIQKILSRYGATESAIVALEILIQTAETGVKSRETEELAKGTCRGLHMDKPGRGVVCAKCFEAAMGGARDLAITGDELAVGRVKAAPLADPVPERLDVPPDIPASAVDHDEIARVVTKMLGEEGKGGRG